MHAKYLLGRAACVSRCLKFKSCYECEQTPGDGETGKPGMPQSVGWQGRAEDAQCESGRPSIMAADRKSVSGSSLAYLLPVYLGAWQEQGTEEGASGSQRQETDR